MNIAVTGHQQLGDSDIVEWLREEIERHSNAIRPTSAYSCLAAGADQLFADVMVQRKIPLVCIIPCYGYENTFEAGDLLTYKKLRSACSKLIQLHHPQPSEIAFYDASKKMVDMCTVLFAVWNNKPARGLGGTADVIEYALKENKQVVHFDLINRTIKNI